jgi:hypothetical protein
MDRLKRLDVADGYIRLLKEVDALRYLLFVLHTPRQCTEAYDPPFLSWEDVHLIVHVGRNQWLEYPLQQTDTDSCSFPIRAVYSQPMIPLTSQYIIHLLVIRRKLKLTVLK